MLYLNMIVFSLDGFSGVYPTQISRATLKL